MKHLGEGEKARDFVKCKRPSANIDPRNKAAFVMGISESGKEQACPPRYGLQAGQPLPTKLL